MRNRAWRCALRAGTRRAQRSWELRCERSQSGRAIRAHRRDAAFECRSDSHHEARMSAPRRVSAWPSRSRHAPLRAATLDAVEYYNAALDHYFVTASPDEIAKLDAGCFVGWQRTQLRFKVFDPATPVSGAVPVCRFYGRPAAGLDSHFYSASAAECAEVRQRFPGAWIEETDNAFGVVAARSADRAVSRRPASRSIGSGTNGSIPTTASRRIRPCSRQMIARGYAAEGYGPGPMPVAMCAPAGRTAGPVLLPSCVLSASNSTPNVGAHGRADSDVHATRRRLSRGRVA